jgi:imidazolonepropionase-like amidohydrolase
VKPLSRKARSRSGNPWLIALALGALCVCGAVLYAQRAGNLRPSVFAIRDARVVPEAGKILPKATVVVRDGLIEALGADVQVPADALAIDGSGLTVYPGFIDALNHWGYDSSLRRSEAGPPETLDLASEALAATRTDFRKGMTPEFQAGKALRADAELEDGWRKLGFTAHLVAPEGGFFAGQSALVSLSGTAPRETVLRSPVALHVAYRASGADYPRALMGVIAHCRQTLLDAGHYRRSLEFFEKNAGRRPITDPALGALGPVIDRKMPVVFEADTSDAISRALDLAAEFNLRAVIFGGRDAWKVADRLADRRVPVVLRLTFAEPSAQEPERGRGRSPEAREGGPVPQRVQAERHQRLEEEMAGAARLHKAGVTFAFSGEGLDKPEKFRDQLRKALAAGLPAEAALKALTSDAAAILGADKQIGTIAPGKAAHLLVTDGDFDRPETRVRHLFADGVHFEYDAKTKGKPAEPAKKPEPAAKDAKEQATELEADRVPRLRTGGNVLIKGAIVLPMAGNTLQADILVQGGKIARIGQELAAPDGTAVIDATGMFVMPGIIDTHAHFAIAGGVNEFSLSVVPEVRVRDVIDSADVEIYRALAGGVTTARLLHGSANVIGGQDAVIKLKYGKSARELLIADAPRGVKFALGENVKRTDGRFPNSRLGVEAVLVRAFSEAQGYRRTWEEYEKAKAAGRLLPEPRRDLRLEALADILKGDLKVHCHCYRADEILMLLRVADRFGFKVKSLQHVLEGYKIGPEIADHGASCSTFSDWWAYKIEAYDAIPFNSALLHEAGVSVCIKSDSNELVRHLYQEAAKCIKYGGLSELEALKTITLNPARQLGLDKRIGTIEAGKDADLAIFNGHPLNSYARCEMTLVEGEIFFQRGDRLVASLPAKESLPVPPAKPFKAIERAQTGAYVILGPTVHFSAKPPQVAYAVRISKGKIEAIELGKSYALDDGDVLIQGTGLHLYPGMIDAATVIGLTELGSARETHDFSESGDFQPDLRASSAVNPDSELIPVTRANGVLTVVTRPLGGFVAGQSCLLNLAGWVPKEMTIVDPLALHVEFPSPAPGFLSDPNTPQVGRAVARKQRDEKVRRLKELFAQAMAYDEARKQSPERAANPRLDALVPYARGTKPVIIQASRQAEIREALKLADDLKLKVILSGAIDAWKLADELKKRDVPVILGPLMAMPAESYDPYDAPFACAAKLHEAGVRFCIRSGGGSNTRNLPYEAAMAVSYGLPPEEGLKAVTLYPAQILGVASQLGSIEADKRANLVLTNGDLLQASTQVLAVFIDGRPLEPVNKQTRLYDRYRERLREVKEGRAPLGTK